MYRKPFLLIFIALVCLPLFNLAAQNFDANDAFNKALILYRNKNYEQAKIQFLTLSALQATHPLRTASLLMLAKSFYALKDHENSLLYADQLIKDYPNSRYTAFAHVVKASVYNGENDLPAALLELAHAVESAFKTDLQNRCEAAGTELVAVGVPIKQFERLYKSRDWVKAQPILNIWRAQLYHQNGESGQALKLIDDFIATKPEPRYRNIAERQRTQFQHYPSRFRLGMVLPVSGYYSTEAKELLSGMALALTQHKKSPGVQLLLADSEGAPVETSRKTNELLEMDVHAVIGELEGDKSALMAGLMSRKNIPLIVPISTDDGLIDKQTIFQINSSMTVRAEALARYAFETLNLRTFATLAPDDDYGKTLVEAFSEAVKRMGGIMVSRQWYSPDSTNFLPQFEEIRRAGFRHSFSDSLRKMGREADAAAIDALYSRMDRNVRYRSDKNEGLAKATNIPLTSIHGLFAPMYEENLPFIASQFALYNIKGTLLSGERCYHLEKLREQQQYLDGMYFFSGYYFSDNDLDYVNFERDYREATSVSPSVMAVYGYNLMNLLLTGIDDGALTGAAMIEYLSQVGDFNGIGTDINLKNHRINQQVNILQFINGNVYRMNSSQ